MSHIWHRAIVNLHSEGKKKLMKDKNVKCKRFYHGAKLVFNQKVVGSGIPFVWVCSDDHRKLKCMCGAEISGHKFFISSRNIEGFKCNKCNLRIINPHLFKKIVFCSLGRMKIAIEQCPISELIKNQFTIRGHSIFYSCSLSSRNRKCKCYSSIRLTNIGQQVPSSIFDCESPCTVLELLRNVKKRKFEEAICRYKKQNC